MAQIILIRAHSERMAVPWRANAPAIIGAFGVLALLAYPSPIVWLGLAAFVALAVARWRHLGLPIPSTALNFPFVLYLVGAALGLAVAVHPPTAEFRFFGMLAALGAFYLLADLVSSPQVARRLVVVTLGAVLVLAPLVLVLVYEFTLLTGLPEPLLGWMAALDPWRNAVLESDEILQRFRLRRSGAGALAAFGVALALGPALVGPTRRTRLLAIAAIAFLSVVLVLADNRGAVLAAILATMLLASSGNRWLLAGALLIAGSVVAVVTGLIKPASNALLAPFVAWVPMRALQVQNIEYRTDLWDHARFLLGDFRFTGVGMGGRSIREVYEGYFLPANPPFSHAHNIFLQTYLEQGPLGLVGLVGIVCVAIVLILRAVSRAQNPDAHSAAISASAAVLVLILAGLTDIVALTTVGMVMLFGTLGLLVAVGRFDEGAPQAGWLAQSLRASGRPAVRFAVVVALLLLLVVVTLWLPRDTLAAPSDRARPRYPLEVLAAQFQINMGAIEVAKVSWGIDRPSAEQEQRLAAADSFLANAMSFDPGNLAIHRLRASALAQSRPPTARRLLMEAQGFRPPDDSLYLFQLGRLYRDIGEFERALDAWATVRAYQQLNQWGARLARRGQWNNARQVYRVVIGTWANDPAGYGPYAAALIRVDGLEGAITEMTRLAAQYAQYPWASLEVARLYERAGDPGQAAMWYQRAALPPNERTAQLRPPGP